MVDVFTDRAYAGNPLAVVLDADRLSTEQMRSLAREFNLWETTFVLPPTTDEAPYLQALGLRAEDLDATPLRRCGCRLDWGFLRVADDALGRIALDATALTALPGAGACVFSYRDGRAPERVFARGVGVSQDPATSSAALGPGVFLVASGLLSADGESS